MSKKTMSWAQKLRQKQQKVATSEQRLALLAQELGVAGAVVLVNDYGFSREQADEWLGKMIEQAKTNRLMLAANTVLAAHDLKKAGKI
jgi:hypothetical protein